MVENLEQHNSILEEALQNCIKKSNFYVNGINGDIREYVSTVDGQYLNKPKENFRKLSFISIRRWNTTFHIGGLLY